MNQAIFTHIRKGAFLVAAMAGFAQAAVTPQEAEQLKTTLTPLGAERTGNKDGSIPAWTGSGAPVAPGYKTGDRRVDPFADEKPLFAITADNMDKYADRLTDGVKALLKKHPKTFRLDVYPTHRTAVAPQYVYEGTLKNATRARIVEDGEGIEGAYAGTPFPIPKSGIEVRWNHMARWKGESSTAKTKIWTVTATGQKVLGSEVVADEQFPYYFRKGSLESFKGEFYGYRQLTSAPSFRAGEALLVWDSSNFAKQDRQAWQYLVGQRRVRRAPTIGEDNPDFVASGANFFDEPFGTQGNPERYDYKLVGKKELFIPYNNNKLFSVKDEQAMGEHHHDPGAVRWELHRVWVVEATLKAGKRHAVPKRIYYQDEDTWGTAIFEGWDSQGKLWRTELCMAFAAPDIPATIESYMDFFYNLATGQYVYRNAMGDSDKQYVSLPPRPESYFSADSLAGMGVR